MVSKVVFSNVDAEIGFEGVERGDHIAAAVAPDRLVAVTDQVYVVEFLSVMELLLMVSEL